MGDTQRLLTQIKERFSECHLTTHPTKTKIVYCKKSGRDREFPAVSFDFLGFAFKPRRTQTRDGRIFTGFNPGISRTAINKVNKELYQLVKRLALYGIETVARVINQKVIGWQNYYGKFRNSDLQYLWACIDDRLMRWARRSYKRLGKSKAKAHDWVIKLHRQNPELFVHWKYRIPFGRMRRAV